MTKKKELEVIEEFKTKYDNIKEMSYDEKYELLKKVLDACDKILYDGDCDGAYLSFNLRTSDITVSSKLDDFTNVFSEYKVTHIDNTTNIFDKIEYKTIREFALKNFKLGFKNGVEFIKLEGMYGNRFNSCILNCSTFEIIELNLEGSRLEDIAPFVYNIYDYTRKLFLEYVLK